MTNFTMRPSYACGAVAIVLALGLATPARCQTAVGTGVLTTKVKLGAKGCGRYKGTGLLTVALWSDDTWTAIDDGGLTLGGTAVPVGSSGRKFDLALDPASMSLLGAALAPDLSGLCQAGVEVTSVEKKRLRLGLSRSGTVAKVKLKYRLGGTANGEPGTATLKLKAKGPWAPVAMGS